MIKNKLIFNLTMIALCLAACQNSTPAESAPAADTPQSESPRTLTICLGYEPDSLYPYAATSQAARDVLQAIYDGPVDELEEQAVPVILTSIPSLKNGKAAYEPVAVTTGDLVVDSSGVVVSLQAGTQVFPSGCTEAVCVVAWDGESPLELDQPRATFELIDGLKWSDGQALTAVDSVYSYELAADPATPAEKTLVESTADYISIDETTVKWTGLPGLVTDQFSNYFWMPLPQHAWSDIPAAELAQSEAASRSPLGYGAYLIDEWVPGEYIRLKKNELYFRADEGLPKFDYLIFKITDPYGDTNMANLKFDRDPYAQFDYDLGEFEEDINQNGCDLTSSTADMSDQIEVLHILMHYFSNSVVQVTDGLGKQAEWLLFNQRASDEGQNAIFSDANMRQAVAACLERGELVDEVFHDIVNVPSSISFNYQTDTSNALLAPDPDKGRQLLTDAGWIDENPRDDNPRTAQNVDGIADGRELSINYLVKDDTLSLAAANKVKESLGECGMRVNLISVSPEVFWDRNSAESIFQGNYHLAQLSWTLPIENPCLLFSSANIPTDENDFIGLNFGGYANAAFDERCKPLANTPLSTDRQILLAEMEDILNKSLALIPLYTSADLMVTRSDSCAVDTGSSSQSELALIELFDYRESCAR